MRFTVIKENDVAEVRNGIEVLFPSFRVYDTETSSYPEMYGVKGISFFSRKDAAEEAMILNNLHNKEK
jgi:hypothetical protein